MNLSINDCKGVKDLEKLNIVVVIMSEARIYQEVK